MYNLPNNIIQLIYSFDSTYHQSYTDLKKEFLQVNDFWGLKFNNSQVSQKMTSDKMRSNYQQIKNLTNYWNTNFLKNHCPNYLENIWQDKNGVCSAIHYTDNNKWGNNWKIFMQNIKCYKFLKSKNCV